MIDIYGFISVYVIYADVVHIHKSNMISINHWCNDCACTCCKSFMIYICWIIMIYVLIYVLIYA